MGISYAEKVVLAASRTVSGTLSLIASAIIINKIVLSARHRRRGRPIISTGVRTTPRELVGAIVSSTTTYQRLLFGMSALDILFSFWAALSTLPVPASSGAVFGLGNTVTCSMQGFFVQFSAATPVYVAALTSYFMMRIRYNISEQVLRKRYRCFECAFHALPLLVAVGGGSIGVGLQIFNPIALPELGCWVASYPTGCHLQPETCTRGYKIGWYSDCYAWFLAFIWIFLSLFVIAVNCCLIYSTIVHQERHKAGIIDDAAADARVSISNDSAAFAATSAMDNGENGIPTAVSKDRDDAVSREYSVERLKEEVEEEGEPSLNAPENEGDVSDDEHDDFDDDDVFAAVEIHEPSTVTFSPETVTTTRSNSSRSRRHRARRSYKTSRVAAVQCLLYVLTALLTTVWSVMPWIGKKAHVESQWRFFFAFMLNIINPSQGVFNLIIYVRLQYLRLRATKPEWSRHQCARFCLFSPDTK